MAAVEVITSVARRGWSRDDEFDAGGPAGQVIGRGH
jgi:hypothetical protein